LVLKNVGATATFSVKVREKCQHLRAAAYYCTCCGQLQL